MPSARIFCSMSRPAKRLRDPQNSCRRLERRDSRFRSGGRSGFAPEAGAPNVGGSLRRGAACCLTGRWQIMGIDPVVGHGVVRKVVGIELRDVQRVTLWRAAISSRVATMPDIDHVRPRRVSLSPCCVRSANNGRDRRSSYVPGPPG